MATLEALDDGKINQGIIVDNVPWKFEPRPLGIILSNACDFQHNKAAYILIAGLMSAKDVISGFNEYQDIINTATDGKLSKSKSRSLKKILIDYIYNANITRYFFIDTADVLDSPSLFIDFQLLTTINFEENEKLEPIAQLPNPYKEKMILHYSSYVSRIAVERIDHDRVEEILFELASPIKVDLP